MKKNQFFTLIAFALIFSFGATAQKLSKTEKKIIANVTTNHSEAVAFLEEMVNINSGTMNLDGVKQVGAEFDIKYKELGF